MMGKALPTIVAGAVILCMSAPLATSANLRIAGGAPGSNAQVAAVGLAQLMAESGTGISLTPLGTNGTTENVRVVERGEAELGVAAAQALYWASTKQEMFADEEPRNNWYAVVPQTVAPYYGVTFEGSGVSSWGDLAGRRVATGPAGSGSGGLYRQLFPVLGLEIDGLSLSWEEGNNQLTRGSVQAHLMAVGRLPASLEAEARLGDRTRFFGISEPAYQEAAKAWLPALSEVTIPAGTWEKQSGPIDTVGALVWIVAAKDADEEAIYQLTKAVNESGQEKLASFGGWPDVWSYGLLPSGDSLAAIGGKLHPGAVRYYEEAGIPLPDAVKP